MPLDALATCPWSRSVTPGVWLRFKETKVERYVLPSGHVSWNDLTYFAFLLYG